MKYASRAMLSKRGMVIPAAIRLRAKPERNAITSESIGLITGAKALDI
jgi:hypothetical protein